MNKNLILSAILPLILNHPDQRKIYNDTHQEDPIHRRLNIEIANLKLECQELDKAIYSEFGWIKSIDDLSKNKQKRLGRMMRKLVIITNKYNQLKAQFDKLTELKYEKAKLEAEANRSLIIRVDQ